MNSHFYALNTSIALSKRRESRIRPTKSSYEIVTKTQYRRGESSIIGLRLKAVCGKVEIEFFLILTSLFSISLFVFPHLEVLLYNRYNLRLF